MKMRPLLFPVVAGSLLCLVLVQVQRPSSPSLELAKTKGNPSAHRASKRSAPSAESAIVVSARDETLALVQRIQAALKTGEQADHDLVFNQLLAKLIEKDTASAASLAESIPPGSPREEMLRRVAQQWTALDPSAAIRWAEALSNESERNSALTDVCFQLAQTDPQQATRVADVIGLGHQPGAILENLVHQWATKDPTAALAWVSERPVGEEKDKMFSRVAIVLADTSPAKAARLVLDQIPAGEIQNEAVISVLYQWTKRDLPEARAWVELFPESPLRERALHEVNGAEKYQSAANQPQP
jgi:hypothetical protein